MSDDTWLRKKPKTEGEPDPLDEYLESARLPDGVPFYIALSDRDVICTSSEWPGDEVAAQIHKLYETTLGHAHDSKQVRKYYQTAERLVAEAAASGRIQRRLPK
jgi:hypothetical protein